MGMHEELVDQLVEQFKVAQEVLTIEMIQSQPQFKVTQMVIDTFVDRGLTEDEALEIISASKIKVSVMPDNMQDLVDAFVDTLLHIRKVLVDAGHSPQYLKAIASQFSLEMS